MRAPLDKVDNVLVNSAKRTHCRRGHEYTLENTKWIEGSYYHPYRECIACTRIMREKNKKKGRLKNHS